MKHKIIANFYRREILGKSKGIAVNWWFILAILFCILFWVATMFLLTKKWQTGVKELMVYSYKPDYSLFVCPPVLTEADCHKRIDLAIINGFDPTDYLLSVYNRLK